jgi:hypothetical protein
MSPGSESPTRLNGTGAQSPTRLNASTRLDANITTKSNDGNQEATVKWAAASQGVNSPVRPLSKNRVRKRPSLFVGTPFNVTTNGESTSPVAAPNANDTDVNAFDSGCGQTGPESVPISGSSSVSAKLTTSTTCVSRAVVETGAATNPQCAVNTAASTSVKSEASSSGRVAFEQTNRSDRAVNDDVRTAAPPNVDVAGRKESEIDPSPSGTSGFGSMSDDRFGCFENIDDPNADVYVTDRSAAHSGGSDINAALWELDSVLALHIDDPPAAFDKRLDVSNHVAPLAFCDDSEDLNAPIVAPAVAPFAACDRSEDLKIIVETADEPVVEIGGVSDRKRGPSNGDVIAEAPLPPHLAETKSDNNQKVCDSGIEKSEQVTTEEIEMAKVLGSDGSQQRVVENQLDADVQKPPTAVRNEHDASLNAETATSPDAGVSNHVSGPSSTVSGESETVKRCASPSATAAADSDKKPMADESGTPRGSTPPTDHIDVDGDNETDGARPGYVMATGMTSLDDGSLIIADYGAGCLCLLSAASDDESAEHEAGDDDTRVRRPVEHRLVGLKPFSVASASGVNGCGSDVVYVGDRRRKTISVFDRHLCDVAQWPDNQFDWICGIADMSTSDGGGLAVIDRSRAKHQLVTYTADGRGPIVEFGPHGNGDRDLCMAEFVAFDHRRGRILVADSGNHCIKMFDPRSGPAAIGRLGGQAARRGAGAGGEMQWPKGLAIDERAGGSDVVYVADSRNGRVLAFDADDGRCLGTAIGGLRSPYAVAVVPASCCALGGVALSDGTVTRLAVTTFSVAGQSEFGMYDVSL